MLEKSLLKDKFSSAVHYIAASIAQETFLVHQTTLTIDCLARLVSAQDRLATWVHFNVTQYSVDVEPCKGEDFREFSTLQCRLEEEYFALSCADVSIASHDITLCVYHETSFVNVDILSSLILAQEKLDVAFFISVEDSHDLLQFKCLAIVVVEFGHEASKLIKLSPVESLDSVLVNNIACFVDKETLQVNRPAKLINVAATTLVLLETQGVLNVVVEERTQKVEWVKVEFFNCVWHRDVASFIKVVSREHFAIGVDVHNVPSFTIDEVAKVVYRSSLVIKRAFASRILIDWHNDVAFVISFEITENINFVELSLFKFGVHHEGGVEGTCLVSRLHHANSMGRWSRRS